MKLRSNILRAASAVVIAAILATVGGFASPSSAATGRIGNAELQAAYTASQDAMLKTGVVYTPSQSLAGFISFEVVLAPKSTSIPGNFGISISTFGVTATVIYSLQEDNPLGMGDAEFGSLLSQQYDVVFPDEAGLVLGETASNGQTLDEYSVTKPDASTIAVHITKSDPLEADENGDPLSISTDYVFTLSNGLVTQIEQTSDAASSLMSGDGVSTFDFSASAIKSHWASLVASWKSTHFDDSTSALATKLTKAYVTSEAAARKYGVTITDTGKEAPAVATYDSKTKKSVIVTFDAKKKPYRAGFANAPATFKNMWSNVLGADYYKTSAIKYSAKSRTYELKGQSGTIAKIKLDTKGRIISTSVKGSVLPETRTITYAPSKATFAKWGVFTAKGQALIQWLMNMKEILLSGPVTYSKKGTVISAKGKYGSSDVVTFNTKGMKTTDVTKVFTLLGLKLGK
jgi:hypothetical protein